jgi:hypothetical protein
MNKTNEIIENFNLLFPIGSKFWWKPVANQNYPFSRLTVKSEAFDSHGQAVVFVEEKTSYISIESQFVDYDNLPF